MNPLPALLACAVLGAQTPAPKPAEPEIPVKGMQGRLFTVKHRRPSDLAILVRPLSSGSPGCRVDHLDNDGLRALSVRDFPENLAVIEEALKRLDQPLAVKRDIEVRIHVLFASRHEAEPAPVQAELKDVVAQLKATLAYKAFAPVATFVHRASAGSWDLKGVGQGEMAFRPAKGEAQVMDLEWEIRSLRAEAAPDGTPAFVLEGFRLVANERTTERKPEGASFRTNLSIKDGERVVVGTSALKDRALIVVVSARALP
ncbi:MAG TPA: hypothetical protein VK188_04305 [Holophaga sp.]|nr:hypothetical protein [Holophaga sp.]